MDHHRLFLAIVMALLCQVQDRFVLSETCPLNQTADSEIGKAPVRFTFSDASYRVQKGVNLGISGSLHVMGHRLNALANCSVSTYMRTSGSSLPISLRIALQNVHLDAWSRECTFKDGVQVSTKPVLSFLQLLNKRSSKSDGPGAPIDWYSDTNNIIVEVSIPALPVSKTATLICSVDDTFDGYNIAMTLEFSLKMAGCPVQKYGVNCDVDCACSAGEKCDPLIGCVDVITVAPDTPSTTISSDTGPAKTTPEDKGPAKTTPEDKSKKTQAPSDTSLGSNIVSSSVTFAITSLSIMILCMYSVCRD